MYLSGKYYKFDYLTPYLDKIRSIWRVFARKNEKQKEALFCIANWNINR